MLMIKQTSYVVLPPTPLNDFMSAAFSIEDSDEAFMQVNVIQWDALGKVKIARVGSVVAADPGLETELNLTSSDYIIWGVMYNRDIRNDIEDVFWNMVDEVDDLRDTGIIDEIFIRKSVGEISEELCIPEWMFRHVFRALSYKMCGGSAPDIPYCNKEGYFVFPSPIGF